MDEHKYKVPEPLLICHECNFSAKHMSSYSRHLATKKCIEQHTNFSKCGKLIKYKTNIYKHQSTCKECMEISQLAMPVSPIVSEKTLDHEDLLKKITCLIVGNQYSINKSKVSKLLDIKKLIESSIQNNPNEESGFSCVCGKGYKHSQSLYKHCKTCPAAIEAKSCVVYPIEKKYNCKCGKSYKHAQSLYFHRKKCPAAVETKSCVVVPVKKNPSCVCGKSYKHKQSLYNHRKKCTATTKAVPEYFPPGASKHRCACGKNYKHKQSLYKHRKICSTTTKAITEELPPEQNIIIKTEDDVIAADKWAGVVSDMVRENQELRKCIFEMMPKMGNTIINNTNNTNNTNNFNMNVFLNEHCKGALNLTDFISKISLNLEDLEKTRASGYITGISNIFIKNLNQLETHERPIHCSDLKRQTMYIKDSGGWGVDNERKTIKKAISEVAKRQIGVIKKWEEQHPDFSKSESQTQEYMEMVRNLTDAGDNPVAQASTEDKIIKTIAKEVIICKN